MPRGSQDSVRGDPHRVGVTAQLRNVPVLTSCARANLSPNRTASGTAPSVHFEASEYAGTFAHGRTGNKVCAPSDWMRRDAGTTRNV